VPPTRRQLELLLAHDPPRPGDQLLDVGCGEGALVELALQLYPQLGGLTAVDVLPGHLERTRALVASLPDCAQAKVRLVLGDGQHVDQALEFERRGATIDKAYLVELTQDLRVAEFERLFDAVFRVLRPGGLIALVVLATNRAPRGLRESVIFDTIVRPFAPREQDLRAVFARYPCTVIEEDWTQQSSRRAAEYFLAHPALVDRALHWPANLLFNAAVRAGLGVIEKGAYSVRLVFVRKAG
jgi:SAM-dependent methyltransferase